jgi:hypothetical protein
VVKWFNSMDLPRSLQHVQKRSKFRPQSAETRRSISRATRTKWSHPSSVYKPVGASISSKLFFRDVWIAFRDNQRIMSCFDGPKFPFLTLRSKGFIMRTKTFWGLPQTLYFPITKCQPYLESLVNLQVSLGFTDLWWRIPGVIVGTENTFCRKI